MAGLPSASLVENARFNACVIIPNALQGIFRRRRAAVAIATRANVDGQAVGLLSGMYRHHGGGPVWVRVVRDPALLLLTPADVHRALEGSPDPFASDPAAKRDGMVAFQPDALTISRGETWRKRREFTDAVLGSGQASFADRFVTVAAEEANRLLTAAREDDGELRWDPWNLAFRRIIRRVILGDAAADDEDLSETLAEMMSEGNGMPGKTSARYSDFVTKLGRYVAVAEAGSLASRFAEAPTDAETKPVGQIPHWMFAAGDTLAINAFRALATILTHPGARTRVAEEIGAIDPTAANADEVRGLAYLEGCLEEAMRLWPTTTMLSRETLADTDWGGNTVPAGTQLLIPNTFLHRDRDRFEYADTFAPSRWATGEAAQEWSFNHLSRGPQSCPGAALTILLGKAALAATLRSGSLELLSPRLDADRPLPHMLDFFGIRIRVGG